MDELELRDCRLALDEMRREHRALDTEINTLIATDPGDEITLMRLKKRKLRLRDQIERTATLLIPDIIA